MMSIIGRIALASVALQLTITAQSGLPCQAPQRTHDKSCVRLKGLKSVDLGAYVSHFDIPQSYEIEKKIEGAAKNIIGKRGLLLGNELGAYLLIDIDGFLVDEKVLEGYLIVQVRTGLSEQAILKRAPLMNDQDISFDTWEIDCVGLVPRKDVEAFIMEKAKEQVEKFCSDWREANDQILEMVSLSGDAGKY